MRGLVGCTVWLGLMLPGLTQAQLDPRRGPPGCVPVAERQMERGCYIIASVPLGTLPDAPLYWRIASFPDRAAAEQAAGPRATVVEMLGRVWLFHIAAAGEAPGGEAIASIGPLQVMPGRAYTAAYMEAILLPGAESGVHFHPGPEAILTLSGEECMETPAGRMLGRPEGSPVLVPANVPHKLSIIGTEERRALSLILHEADKPPIFRTHEHGWTPQGLCRQG